MAWQVRSNGLIVTEAGDDLIVYDEEGSQIHTLNSLATSIWRQIDKADSIDDLAEKLGLSPDTVSTAIASLQNANLLTGRSGNHLPSPGMTRRRLMRGIGASGAVTLPIIVSVSAPRASMANSLCSGAVQLGGCETNGQECLIDDTECGGACIWTTIEHCPDGEFPLCTYLPGWMCVQG